MNKYKVPIPGYEGYYWIDRDGGIYSRYKKRKTFVSTMGYDVITLTVKSKPKTHNICTLLAKAFIPNPRNDREVNHIDRNKRNNNLNNLEWCNRSENMLHAHKDKIIKPKNESGHKYVYKYFGKWVVRMPVGDVKVKHIGYFDTVEEALEARNKYMNYDESL